MAKRSEIEKFVIAEHSQIPIYSNLQIKCKNGISNVVECTVKNITLIVPVPFLLFRAHDTGNSTRHRYTGNSRWDNIASFHSLILINSRRKALKFLGTLLRTNLLQDVFFTVLVLYVVDKILPFFTLRKTEHRRRTKQHMV